jgi:cell division septation protein DedD
MQDQNFHEIQLSGKQLLFGFISAVALLLVVFLLGVSVGRGVRTETTPGDLSAATGPGVPGDTTVPATPPPGAPLPGDLTYQETLKGRPAGATPPPPPAPPADPPQTAAPPPEPKVDPPVASKPPPPPASATTTPAAAASGGWFLQTGAYGTQRAAENWVRELKAKGIAAFVTQYDKFYRVRVGPFATEAEAQREQARILKAGIKSSVVR